MILLTIKKIYVFGIIAFCIYFFLFLIYGFIANGNYLVHYPSLAYVIVFSLIDLIIAITHLYTMICISNYHKNNIDSLLGN